MKRKWLLVGVMVPVLAVLGLAGCAQPGTTGTLGGVDLSGLRVNFGGQQEGVSVSGEGKVTVVPDIVTLSLGVVAQKPTVAEAQASASDAMDRVMTALASNNVADRDIRTQQFSIQQITRFDEKGQQETVIGYRVTNFVTAKVRALGKAGVIIDAVVRAGGDLTRINSIDFSVENPEQYYREAREKAMADALAKARQMATLAGIALGKPVMITENVQAPFAKTVFRESVAFGAPALAAPPVSGGEQEIVINVQIVFSIN